MKNKILIFLCSILLFTIPISSKAQNNGLFKSFFKLSFPEKIWAITHPFIAKKAWKITKNAIAVTKEIEKDTTLDRDTDGGQVDAFRHTYWMASLAQKINSRKVRKLGLVHEKANYINFKKNQKEDNSLPDAANRDMDLQNNDYGIYIGNNNKNLDEKDLIILVKKAILEGKVWKINKNKKGESLDCKGDIIPLEKYFKKWDNPRCLVRSDKIRL